MCYDVIKRTQSEEHICVNINQLERLHLMWQMKIVAMSLVAGLEA